MTDYGAAATALADARAARAQLARKLDCPPWAHAIIGVLYAALVGCWSGPEAMIPAVELAVVVAIGAVFVWTRRRLGVFVNGYRRGRTRPIALAMVGAYLVCFSLAAWLRVRFDLRWPALALALVMLVVGTWGSVAWNRTYRDELANEPAGGL